MVRPTLASLTRVVVCCAGALFTLHAAAQANSDAPITFVVGYPPGGGADLMARLVQPKMAALLGTSIVIDNRPGVAGQIGAAYVARSKPDGNTVFIDASSYVINLGLYPKLTYSAASFETVGVIATLPLVLVVNPEFPAKSVADLITIAKAKPGSVFYGTSGTGSAMQIASTVFAWKAGVDMVAVPYKGGGPALTGVLGNQVPVYISNAAIVLPHIRAGRLRALAVTGPKRAPVLPDVPTLNESGVPDNIIEWNGMYVAAGTPPKTLDRLSAALRDTLKMPDVRKALADATGEPVDGTRAESTKFVKHEAATMAKIIKDRDIHVE